MLLDGDILVMGGDSGVFVNDIWKSVDGGRAWTLVTGRAQWEGQCF
jgi:hypothetical protein